MKTLRIILELIITLIVASCVTVEYNDAWIKEEFADLEQRMTDLETRVNSNIASLTEIVTALQQGDYILSYAPYLEDRVQVGYQLNFAKSGSIIIYFGKDGKDGENGNDGKDGDNGKDGAPGKDGANGKDGADGHTPQIGVKLDTDGIWYWTLDGSWLLDDNGDKVKAVGTDGKDGADGKDGKDGQDGKDGKDGLNGGRDGVDGKDGKDGITPQLKIDNGYWWMSIDNGITWTQVGKATGDNGANGKDGKDGKDGTDGSDGANGKDGDSFFKSVTEDDNYVYLTLSDNTVINIPKSSTLEVTFNPAGNIALQIGIQKTITYEVTSSLTPVTVEVVTSSDIKARVTPADANGLSGTITVVAQSETDEYSKIVVFVDNGENVITKSFTSSNGGLIEPPVVPNYEWVDLGLPSGIKWATCNVGATQPEEYGDYFAWGDTEPNYVSQNPLTWKSGKTAGYT